MRIMGGQVVVITVGALTLAATAAFLAPRLFAYHFAQTGEADPHVQYHAQQAFDASFALALTLGVLASMIGAVLLSWLLARRISRPIQQLSQAAEAVAAGHYSIAVPHDTFGSELAALSDSFEAMASQLDETEASRRRLLADLAHELRTPLATLEAHIDGLEDGIVKPTPETFAIIRQQVARLRRLTFDMRTLTEVEAHALDLHLTELTVDTVLAEACEVGARGFSVKGVLLTRTPCTHGTSVNVDPDRVQQVFGNLLANALRHTPAAGTVSVTCECDAEYARFVIADTGEGIAPDQLTAVFDRFHRADRSRHHDGEGSGLGLTIARGIVQDHGGTLTAISDGLGRGSQFVITMPRADGTRLASGSDTD